MKIALVACSSQKRSEPCRACELYEPSRLFSLSWRWAGICADRRYILSARYGLLDGDTVVAPYNLCLADLPPKRQEDWAAYVLRQLSERCDPEKDEFILLAGRDYYRHLLPRLKHARLPLGSMRYGERCAFLERQLAGDRERPDADAALCLRLHRLFAALPRYTWRDIDRLPFDDGIYLFFEQGERYHDLPRVVRVGTHRSAHRLKPRLRDHFLVEDRSGSIFRKNLGKALLNRAGDPALAAWSRDGSAEYPQTLADTERAVSRILRDNFAFTAFPCPAAALRLRLEEAIIASLHRAPDFGPGPDWLGLCSPEPEIAGSGLWLKQGLDAEPLTGAELTLLESLASGAKAPAVRSVQTEEARGEKTGTAEIRRYVLDTLRAARDRGEADCVLVSGQIHKELGLKSKMPSVCAAMYAVMAEGDEILHTTPSGKSSTIEIRYRLTNRAL